jgi:hypothetical protein
VEAERCLVAVYTLDLLRSVDAAVLADPVPNPHVIRMSILSESGSFGLFW